MCDPDQDDDAQHPQTETPEHQETAPQAADPAYRARPHHHHNRTHHAARTNCMTPNLTSTP